MKKTANIDCVLLIDDDEITNYLNKMIISDMRVSDSIEATSKVETAMEFILSCYKDEDDLKSLLIFLDINMPVWDGFEFLDQLNRRKTLPFHKMDIIILSTSLNKIDQEKARTYPILDYIIKPLTPEKVAAALKKNNAYS